MFNLIKVDLKRVLKDKLLIVILAICAVFAFVGPTLYRVILGFLDEEFLKTMPDLISAKTYFFNSFAFNDNFGLVVPVLIAIIIRKDFSHGTVRNKIICGKKRSAIFGSMFTVSAISVCTIILLHALITLAISLVYFDYQQSPFTAGDFGYLMLSVAFEMLLYTFLASILCWFCSVMKNSGLVIVLYLALVIVATIVTAIVQVALVLFELDGGYEVLVKVLDIIQHLNIFNYGSIIGRGTEYTVKEALFLALTPIAGTTAFYLLGNLCFNKKDIK